MRADPVPRTKLPHPRALWSGLIIGTFLLMLTHCTIAREFPTTPIDQNRVLYQPEVTYQSLKPTLTTRCLSCHNSTRTEGKYDMSSYAGLRGTGTDDTPNAKAGDKDSLLLTRLRADDAVKEHRVEEALSTQLRRWLVDFKMAYFRSGFHTSDIHTPGEPGFHGNLLKQSNWNWKQCTQCHGTDLSGGSSDKSCLHCHNTKTSQGCASCHTTGATQKGPFRSPSTSATSSAAIHQRHLQGDLAQGISCRTCHVTPSGLRDGQHLDGKTQVQFSQHATLQGKSPQWKVDDRTCSETYCHTSGLKGTLPTPPKWAISTPTKKTCQGCHENPPKTLRDGRPHPPDERCAQCHQTSHKDGTIKTPSLHINGQVEVLFQGNCSSCHGDEKSAAPPKDLSGNTATTARGVGAHRAHLTENGRTQVVPCNACHTVPGDTFATGHIDTQSPAEILFGYLAKLDGLKPSWMREKNTCGQTYCHGASLDGGKHTAPVWTEVGKGQNQCDSCHGMPPRKTRSGASHTPSKECHLCHRNVKANGTFIQPKLHINGRVEL